MDTDCDTCRSCMGTGIGNPNVERSVCSSCNGRGVTTPPKASVDEDRWAWNHFEPEPGDVAFGPDIPLPHPDIVAMDRAPKINEEN